QRISKIKAENEAKRSKRSRNGKAGEKDNVQSKQKA
ncbi:hypothetical protein Tco_1084506, partial [Tanacetum coccineum]